MSTLHIQLLGTPIVHHNQDRLSFRTRKTLALLVYLVVEGGMHSREKLATLLWPESEPDAGRATLRSTLRYLRQALDHTTQGEIPPHLAVERDSLGFNFTSAYTLDLEEVEEGIRLPAEIEWDQVEILDYALDAAKGEFLEGFTLPDAAAFDDWSSLQREHWHMKRVEIYDRLSRRQLQAGRKNDAIRTAAEWIKVDPFQELAYQRLIRAQLAAGKRSAALETYRSCRQTLQEELGIDPSPKTDSLAQKAKTGVDLEAAVHTPTERAEEVPRKIDTPLVGRQGEHQQLVETYQHVNRGGSRVIFLEGEAGIGKTRLAKEFVRWAGAEGADVLQGKAFESDEGIPYQVVVDALRPRVDHENAPEDLLDDVWMAELSRLLPELRSRYPDLPRPTSEESAAQMRLFEAVVHLFKALADRVPVVFFADDLQWADTASLDLLRYLTRRMAEETAPVCLLFSLRSEVLAPVRTESTLREWVAGMARERDVKRLRLTSLSFGDVQDLVDQLFDADKNDVLQESFTGSRGDVPSDDEEFTRADFGRWLFNESGGQPFYLSETITTLVDRGMLRWERTAEGDWRLRPDPTLAGRGKKSPWDVEDDFVPPAVRDVIQDRLSQLSPSSFNMLSAGAVLSREFTFDDMCRIAGIRQDEGLFGLDELRARRLLENVDDGLENYYAFSHDKIRDVVYTEAGNARRTLYHERAFRYLKEKDARAASLARHASAAQLMGPAFHYALQAGEDAMDLYAVGVAVEQYQQAKQILEENPDIAGEVGRGKQRQLYERLGRALELDHNWERAKGVYQDMLQRSREEGDSKMEVAALNELSDLAVQTHMDVDQASQYLTEARKIAEENGHKAGIARMEWCLAQVKFYSYDREGALEHGESALRLAREIDDQGLVALALNALGYAKHGPFPPSQLAQALEHAHASQEIFSELGNRAMEVDSITLAGSVKIHLGQSPAAVEIINMAREISREIGNSWGQSNTAFNLARAQFECGHYEEAFSLIHESLDLARDQELTYLVAGILSVRGGMYREICALEKAIADHKNARSIFGESPNPHVRGILDLDLCADYVFGAEWEKATRFAEKTLTSNSRSWLFGSLGQWCLVEALGRAGKTDRAEEAAARFGRQIGDNPRYRITHLRSRAAVADCCGETGQAVESLEKAATLADKLNLPGESWQIRAKLGEYYHDMGETSRSREVRKQAAGIAYRLGQRLSAEDQRDTFLASRAVRQLPMDQVHSSE